VKRVLVFPSPPRAPIPSGMVDSDQLELGLCRRPARSATSTGLEDGFSRRRIKLCFSMRSMAWID
jgi:hypothetical protein